METLKNALAFYPLYVVLMTVFFRMFDATLAGFLYGLASYPLLWYTFIIMNMKDKVERNGKDTSNACERKNDNCR